MKLNRKNILACALCAGLMTLGTAKTQAVVVDNQIAASLNVQLTALTTTSNGKVQKTRITTKDLLNSIGFNAKGNTIVILEDDSDVFVMNKQGVLIENLTADGILEISYDTFFQDQTSTKGGGFRESFTGTAEIFFASAGSFDTISSDLTFDLDGTYIWVVTSNPVPKLHGSHAKVISNRFFETLNVNFFGLGNEGFDFDINETDTIPISGSVIASGSGLINPI